MASPGSTAPQHRCRSRDRRRDGDAVNEIAPRDPTAHAEATQSFGARPTTSRWDTPHPPHCARHSLPQRRPKKARADGRGRPLSFWGWHRNTGNFYLNGAEMVSTGEVEGLPVVAAKGQISGGRRSVHDAGELLALWVDDPQPASAAAINVSLDVYLHAVGDAGLVAAQIDKDTIGVLGERAIWRELKGAEGPAGVG